MELTTRAGKSVAPLGLAGRPGLEGGCVDAAFAAGLDYFFFYSGDCAAMLDGLAVLCRDCRDEVFIATGSESRDPQRLRAYRDETLRRLGAAALDIFFSNTSRRTTISTPCSPPMARSTNWSAGRTTG